jgi:hypothetical protein
MASTLEAFLTEYVEPDLIALGFHRRGHLFWTVSDEDNLGILHVQNTNSVGDVLVFTMKLAVSSKRINDALGRRTAPHQPLSNTDAWYRWIGKIDERFALGWTIEPEDRRTIGPRVRDAAVNVAVPAIVAHMSDESLRDRWLTKTDVDDSFDNDAVRLGRLVILLEAIGPRDSIPAVRAELNKLAEDGQPLAILWRDRQPGADPDNLFAANAIKLSTPGEWVALANASTPIRGSGPMTKG